MNGKEGLQELSGGLRTDCQSHETYEELSDIVFSTIKECTPVPKHEGISEKSKTLAQSEHLLLIHPK